MIRVNLLDDIKIAMKPDEQSLSDNLEKKYSITKGQFINAIIKVCLILLLPLAMYGWNLTEKLSQNRLFESLEAQKQEVLDKISKQKVQYDAIKALQEEKLKLDSLVEHLSQIINQRILNIESLDVLHSLVPDRTWLTNIEFVEDNKVNFIGESEPLDVQVFVNNLNEKNNYYKNAKISQVDSTTDGYQEFHISSELNVSEVSLSSEVNLSSEISPDSEVNLSSEVNPSNDNQEESL